MTSVQEDEPGVLPVPPAQVTQAADVVAVYGGVIQGNIALVKAGNSTLQLSGASTYSGGTTLNGGWLDLQNYFGSATGLGTVTFGTVASA